MCTFNLKVLLSFVCAFSVWSRECYSSELGLFNSYHSGANVEKGAYTGWFFEGYANKLVNEYTEASNKPNYNLGTTFSFDRLKLHWVDAVVHPERTIGLADQVVMYVKENAGNLQDDQALALFLLLQELKRKQEIIELLELFSSQLRSNVIRRVVMHDSDYLEFVPEIAALSSDEVVTLWSAGSAFFTSRLSDLIDQYFILLVMEDSARHEQILPYINDPDTVLAAKGFAALLTEEEKAVISSRYLQGEYFRYPLAFVFSRELAQRYLEQYFSIEHPTPPESHRYLYEKYPDLVDAHISKLCNSNELKDVATALRFRRRLTGEPVFTEPKLLETVTKLLNETSESDLDGPGVWELQFCTFELVNSEVRLSPAIASRLSPEKLAFMQRNASDINISCRLTFEAWTLRDAVLAILEARK